MKIYTYIHVTNDYFIQKEKEKIDLYTNSNKISITKEFRNEKELSQNNIQNYINEIITELSMGDRLIVLNLSILGNSSFKILQVLESAYLKSISIYSINQDLLICRENKELYSMAMSLLHVEKSLKRKKLLIAKETHQKNKTKPGRKSGKKTKSMFDKDRRKIMRLHKQGVPKTKILDEIKKSNQRLAYTSPQALGQYIKKIEQSLKEIENRKLFIKPFVQNLRQKK